MIALPRKAIAVLCFMCSLFFAAMFTGSSTANAAPGDIFGPQNQLGAGEKIVMLNPDGTPKSQCTVAAVGSDQFGNHVALTAGHCAGGVTGGTVVSADGTVVLGTFATVKSYPMNVPIPGFMVANVLDYAFIKLNPDIIMTDYALSPVNVKKIVAPTQFQFPVCKFGFGGNQPSEKCGVNTAIRPLEFETTALVDFGDSGGPVYVYGSQLTGIVSRPVGVPYVSTTIITRADAAVRDATASGSVGAGFVPVA